MSFQVGECPRAVLAGVDGFDAAACGGFQLDANFTEQACEIRKFIESHARGLVLSRALLVPIVTTPGKRTHKVEKLARIYDDEIAPCWGTRFGRLLLRDLAVPERGQVLDVSCGTGAPTIEILRRMSEGSRIIAIDESSAMLDVVRRKVAELGPLGKKGVFFRTESAVPKLSFADDVYDLVVCNLGVGDMPSIEVALRDFARVAKPGGEVRCTLPLAGTFEEFHDLYREVLIKHDKHDALDRLEHHISRYPTFERAERGLAAANLTGGIEVEEFSLLFRSSREFFFAPVIEYGPLADWKAIVGDGQDMQDVFWYIKEAIDAYFAGGPFHVTVKAACVIGKKPDRHALEQLAAERRAAEAAAAAESLRTAPVPRTSAFDDAFNGDEPDAFDELDTGLPWPPQEIALGSMRVEEPEQGGEDLPELSPGELSLDEESRAEPTLDAFSDGKDRPLHLAD